MFCEIDRCRFPSTHTNQGHKCGTCGRFGHGQIECRNASKQRKIRRGQILPMELMCTYANCRTQWTHTADAHYCSVCDIVGHECDTTWDVVAATISKKCPTCRCTSEVNFEVVHTSTECIVCMENRPKVVFLACKHANVCKECALKL